MAREEEKILPYKINGSNAKVVQIANRVGKVLDDNPAMIEVWIEWCLRENQVVTGDTAVLALYKLYRAALQ